MSETGTNAANADSRSRTYAETLSSHKMPASPLGEQPGHTAVPAIVAPAQTTVRVEPDTPAQKMEMDYAYRRFIRETPDKVLLLETFGGIHAAFKAGWEARKHAQYEALLKHIERDTVDKLETGPYEH
jgi:hypothetical protein